MLLLSILAYQYELRLVASDNLNENYTTIVIHVNDGKFWEKLRCLYNSGLKYTKLFTENL